jgi:hypothetical protein
VKHRVPFYNLIVMLAYEGADGVTVRGAKIIE